MKKNDEEARVRAVRDLDRSVVLTAGAGSGKTSVMAQRVVGLLAAGVDPSRIAAVTFTEKAAGELAERVRDLLEQRAPAMIDRLPALTVSTIHGFCQTLLRADALEAGWAPATEIHPEIFQSAEVELAFRTWFAGFVRRWPLPGALVRHLVKPDTLRKGVFKALAVRDLDPDPLDEPFDLDRAAVGLVGVASAVLEAAGGCRAPDTDVLLAANRSLLELLRTVGEAPPERAVRLAIASEIVGSRAGGRKEDWAPDGKEVFLTATDRFRDWRRTQLGAVHAVLIRDVWTHFLPSVEAAKRGAAVADFDDQLFRAAALLRDPEVRRRLAGRFDRVLIDEVQDTDPIQAEIAVLLTRDPDAEGAWGSTSPLPARLFAVGDPRQSIYRFRRADLTTWKTLHEVIGRSGAALDLSTNFRSVPGIVAWVEATFPDLHAEQHAFRAPAVLEPVVRLATAPDREVEDVARYLWTIHGQPIIDRSDGRPRPLRWSDLMVLIPGWTHAERVQATLTRGGIPCVVEGGGAYFGREEVRLGLAVLRSLDEPADEPSTVLVLRGLFGIDWEALARHRAAGGSWLYVADQQPPGPIAEAFASLRELGRRRGQVSWVVLLDEILERSCAAAVWAARVDGEARLANIEKLRALIRNLERVVHAPGEVVARLVAASSGREEDDLSRLDDDHHAVRITSYFKSKGLEAPVVVLAVPTRKTDGAEWAIDRSARTVALKVGDLASSRWEALAEREKAASLEERRRWMYVAATRARDQLVFVHHEKARLIEHFERGFSLASTVEGATLPEIHWREESFPEMPPVIPETVDPVVRWKETRERLVAEAKSRSVRWCSVHELAHREVTDHPPSPVGQLGGTVVHEVMEILDLSRPSADLLPHVPALVAASAAACGLDRDRAARCVQIVQGMLRHPVLEQARAAPERWVEVPFSLREEGRVVSGRIDLCFPTDGSRTQWVVVDWKSDLPPRDSPGFRNYEAQLAWYARALLRTVSPCEQVETVLVGPYPELD